MKISFLLMSILHLVSCTKDSNTPDPDQPGTKAYTITGTVKDAAGNVVKSARIRVENPTGDNIHYNTTSDGNGKYSVTVSAIGGYKIYAWKEAEFEGELYQVRLGMEKEADYDAFSVPAGGVVKNFVWKLNGRIPDRVASKENGTGYFGGTLKLINYNSMTDQLPAGTEVTVTLSPLAGAKYLDGSDATDKLVERKFNIATGVGQAYYINDIPATRYRITALGSFNGVSKRIDLGLGSPDELKPSQDYIFPPEGGSGSYESGLGSPNETAFYLMKK